MSVVSAIDASIVLASADAGIELLCRPACRR